MVLMVLMAVVMVLMGFSAMVMFLAFAPASITSTASHLSTSDVASEVSGEGAVEEGLEEVFGLAGGFALLAADTLKLLDDRGEFFL